MKKVVCTILALFVFAVVAQGCGGKIKRTLNDVRGAMGGYDDPKL